MSVGEVITAAVAALTPIGGGIAFIWRKIEKRFADFETRLKECQDRERASLDRRAVQLTVIAILWQEVTRLAPDTTVLKRAKKLLDDLQDEMGLTYVFVAHDIGVVRHISDRIAVMNHGKIVETGDADQVCEHPRDDYTKKLLAAVPIPDPRESRARRERATAG